MSWESSLGAVVLDAGQCRFSVWAPTARRVEVHIIAPQERVIPLDRTEGGYHLAVVDHVSPGTRYTYRLDGAVERPDPVSRSQPQGVHQPSEVVDRAFAWDDRRWFGRALQDYLIYELHVGTYTPEGTFEALIPHLHDLKELGITAIELMPIAQFPGSRNWGYDGVYPYAVQHSYGGPTGLKRFVNACHAQGLAVVLDVVYNHLGPEGNYLAEFGPYFTDRYQTPWGDALNFDGPQSDGVRRYFIENALTWVTEFHVDALRLDAIDAMYDSSAQPFVRELASAVQLQGKRLNRRVFVLGEGDQNDTRIIKPREQGGFGLDAQWNDDFHHALHTLLTPDRTGYYQDFGTLEQLAMAFRDGFVYAGQYSAFRQRRHGSSSRACPAHQFVVCSQNHDQVGNRLLGERLSHLVSFEQLKLAASTVLLSPFIPLIFMGEEYAETAPFQYFVSHSDPALIESVRQGRREEFKSFAWPGEPVDPQDEATYRRCRLNLALRQQGHHHGLRTFYTALIRLRKKRPALASLDKEMMEVRGDESKQLLWIRRWREQDEVFLVFNFSDAVHAATLPMPQGAWVKQLDSADRRWKGSGTTVPDTLDSIGAAVLRIAPHACVVFARK